MAPFNGHPMAKAAVEMAVLDAELRARRTSFADHLGAVRTVVTAGVSVGIMPTRSLSSSTRSAATWTRATAASS